MLSKDPRALEMGGTPYPRYRSLSYLVVNRRRGEMLSKDPRALEMGGTPYPRYRSLEMGDAPYPR